MEKFDLNKEEIKEIKEDIKNLKETDIYKRICVNEVPRDDVLNLLDEYCTVIYYPLEDEENHGFHINGIPDASGKDQHFVFINTAQTMDKQIFTAAHELGHIRMIDEKIIEKFDLHLTEEDKEKIINRFAAELLIPKEKFLEVFNEEYSNFNNKQNGLTIENWLEIIVKLMNAFFVPFKSIVIRFYELNIFDDNIKQLLLGKSILDKDIIDGEVKNIILNFGYTRLMWKSEKKFIAKLSSLIENAEKNKSINENVLNKLREEFSIPRLIENKNMDMVIDTKKETENGN